MQKHVFREATNTITWYYGLQDILSGKDSVVHIIVKHSLTINVSSGLFVCLFFFQKCAFIKSLYQIVFNDKIKQVIFFFA